MTDLNSITDLKTLLVTLYQPETPMLLKKKADMIVYAETACDFIMIPKFMFYSLIDRYSLFKNQMLLVAHSRIGLQGIDPNTHAPFLKKAFEEAA